MILRVLGITSHLVRAPHQTLLDKTAYGSPVEAGHLCQLFDGVRCCIFGVHIATIQLDNSPCQVVELNEIKLRKLAGAAL